MPEFFHETRFTHFTKVKSDFTFVKCPSLLEEGEEYKEGINTYSRACAREYGLFGNKKLGPRRMRLSAGLRVFIGTTARFGSRRR